MLITVAINTYMYRKPSTYVQIKNIFRTRSPRHFFSL